MDVTVTNTSITTQQLQHKQWPLQCAGCVPPHRGKTAGREVGCTTVGEGGGRRVHETSLGGPACTGPGRRGGRPARPFASPLSQHWPGTCPAGHGSPCDTPPEVEGEDLKQGTLSPSNRETYAHAGNLK